MQESSLNTQSEYNQQYVEIQLLDRHYEDNSTLYLIRNKQNNRYRMAKKFHILENDSNTQDFLLNQVLLLKDLFNPHIMRYYDVFLEKDQLISILEFCEEGDIYHYLEKRKQRKQMLSQKLLISWLMQILMALEYIHTKSIVHRLISSHNIFMNHQGDLKIGSFGAAKILDNTMSKAFTLVNEPCYMCPQMLQGKPYDSKADIWALGCLVYQMANYKNIFEMGNLTQLYDKIVKQPCPELPVKYSRFLSPLYKKMMKKAPQARPSASQLLQQDVFLQLMKQYSKKKRIEALDLKGVGPKQLGAHKKFQSKQFNKNTPTFPSISNGKLDKHQKDSQIKKRQKSQDKTKIREDKKQVENIKKQQANLKSPLIKKKNQLKKITSGQKNNEKQSKQQQKTSQNSPQNLKFMKTQTEYQRLTIPNWSEAEYISALCEIKLQLLSKKYEPNMSKILEQTIEFDVFND